MRCMAVERLGERLHEVAVIARKDRSAEAAETGEVSEDQAGHASRDRRRGTRCSGCGFGRNVPTAERRAAETIDGLHPQSETFGIEPRQAAIHLCRFGCRPARFVGKETAQRRDAFGRNAYAPQPRWGPPIAASP